MPLTTQFEWRLFPYLHTVIKQFGTPFQVYDSTGISQSLEHVQKTFEGHLQFENFFSVATCHNQAILKKIQTAGLSFECTNILELESVTQISITSSRILFTSNNPADEELEYACKNNCILSIDNVNYLKKPVIRENIPSSIYFILSRSNILDIEEDDGYAHGLSLEQLINTIQHCYKLGTREFGLGFTTGTSTRDYAEKISEIKCLLEIVTKIKKGTGISIDSILQKGFGIPHQPEENSFDLQEFERLLQECLTQFKSENGFFPDFKINCSEYIIAQHACFVNRAINRKDVSKQSYIGLNYSDPCMMKCSDGVKMKYNTVLNYIGNNVTDRSYEMVTILNSYHTSATNSSSTIALPRIVVNHEHPELSDLLITHDTGVLNFEAPQVLMIEDKGLIKSIMDTVSSTQYRGSEVSA